MTCAHQHRIQQGPFPSRGADCPCQEMPATTSSICVGPETPLKTPENPSRPPRTTQRQPKIKITDTHSVSAVVDCDSRLSSLAHPYWNVALWVGESHVDHCKENQGWLFVLKNLKLSFISYFNILRLKCCPLACVGDHCKDNQGWIFVLKNPTLSIHVIFFD